MSGQYLNFYVKGGVWGSPSLLGKESWSLTQRIHMKPTRNPHGSQHCISYQRWTEGCVNWLGGTRASPWVLPRCIVWQGNDVAEHIHWDSFHGISLRSWRSFTSQQHICTMCQLRGTWQAFGTGHTQPKWREQGQKWQWHTTEVQQSDVTQSRNGVTNSLIQRIILVIAIYH